MTDHPEWPAEERYEDKALSIVEELKQAVASLGKQVDYITDRLSPVLRPHLTDTVMQDPSNVPSDRVAPIRAVLNDVHRHTSRLLAVTERLEV